MIKKPITTLWKKAKLLSEENNVGEALPMLEELIIRVADASSRGVSEIEGVPVDLWKSRFWDKIEQIGCLPEYREEKES